MLHSGIVCRVYISGNYISGPGSHVAAPSSESFNISHSSMPMCSLSSLANTESRDPRCSAGIKENLRNPYSYCGSSIGPSDFRQHSSSYVPTTIHRMSQAVFFTCLEHYHRMSFYHQCWFRRSFDPLIKARCSVEGSALCSQLNVRKPYFLVPGTA